VGGGSCVTAASVGGVKIARAFFFFAPAASAAPPATRVTTCRRRPAHLRGPAGAATPNEAPRLVVEFTRPFIGSSCRRCRHCRRSSTVQ